MYAFMKFIQRSSITQLLQMKKISAVKCRLDKDIIGPNLLALLQNIKGQFFCIFTLHASHADEAEYCFCWHTCVCACLCVCTITEKLLIRNLLSLVGMCVIVEPRMIKFQ